MNSPSLSLVEASGRIFFVRGGGEPRSIFARSWFRLVEAVYAEHPGQARRILRHRIHTSEPLSWSDREAIQVAAKRISEASLAELEARLAESPLPKTDLGEVRIAPTMAARLGFRPGSDAESALPSDSSLHALENAPTLLRELLAARAAEVVPDIPRFESHRPIAAALYDAEGRLLETSRNENARVRTRHAEIELLRARLARGEAGVPRGATLVVSLKPCPMCAAAIARNAEDLASLRVLYIEDDPGRLARNTCLMDASPARRDLEAEFPALRGRKLSEVFQSPPG